MKNQSHFLIVGLGNPGSQYIYTRHNVGFRFADQMARYYGVAFKEKNNYHLALSENAGQKVFILKPAMYMNLSGIPVLHVASYYKIVPERILVAYDDIALPLGKIRLRKKGSAGGHNGMKSIIESLGKDDFSRMRLGIGSPEGQSLEKYVLSGFSKSEEKLVESMLDTAQNACLEILSGGMDSAMNLYNGTETV